MTRSDPIRCVRLRPAVHIAAVDEHLVLLDVSANAYLCLAGAADAEIQADGRTLRVADADLGEALVAGGLAEPCVGDETSRRRSAPSPRTSALRADYPRPRVRDLGEVLVALLDLVLHYRGRSFAHIVDSARKAASSPAAQARADAFDLVDRFHTWSPFTPVSGKCLLRSFMLLRYLRRSGHAATWVFGVSTWPFQAHCWLQIDDVVLDDEVDRIIAFKPIMAL